MGAVMQVSDEPAQGEKPRAGFALPLDILIAPQRAFRTIAATREWLPAALVIVVLAAIGTALIAPAVAHVAKAQLIANQHGHPSDKELAGAARTDIVLTFLSGTVLQVFPLTLTAMVLSTAGRLKGQTTPLFDVFRAQRQLRGACRAGRRSSIAVHPRARPGKLRQQRAVGTGRSA